MIYNTILLEIKNAMKNKEESKKNVLKQVQSKAQMIAKENKLDEITDDIVIKSIEKELKQLNQTKDSLKGHEDSELFKETEYKISILVKYLPEKMTAEEVESELVDKVLSGMKMGDAMRVAKQVIGNKADSSVIAQIVKKMIL